MYGLEGTQFTYAGHAPILDTDTTIQHSDSQKTANLMLPQWYMWCDQTGDVYYVWIKGQQQQTVWTQ